MQYKKADLTRKWQKISCICQVSLPREIMELENFLARQELLSCEWGTGLEQEKLGPILLGDTRTNWISGLSSAGLPLNLDETV